ncbi:efflux RND transporter periplasmic adaptor subunit [Neptunicella marina]|uniref:Efflux RND transporter periplasmic adaptor subunit n=1 Tax=Neptunicella marina TaxID=2125989 RepID=A0A8J6M3T4_9ALTE|nr:efflux RND transporter periplasmic adaptor subunit [Neptunicella marina]MBC3767422.1 efflux RND transporter periplasmic adaptor subunit [Neptunicella marina]
MTRLTRAMIGLAILGLMPVTSTVAQQATRPANVVVQALTFEPEQTNLDAVGTAEGFKSVNIYPAAADKVTAVNFVPGQHVNKGDVLIELDARRQIVAVQRAEIELKDAERSLKRLLDSQNNGAVTQSAIDDARTQRDLAEVALKAAQADLQDRHLRAPFSGILGLTDVEVGDRITLQTLVTSIDSRQKLYVNFKAPETALKLLKDSASISLEPWTEVGRKLEAQIAQIDSRVDQQDRSLRVRALLDNSEDEFRPGMSFKVNLTLLSQPYAAIPEAALSWAATGAYVWLAKDNKAYKVDVNIKQRLRGKILVEGNLQPGNALITEGIQQLRQDQPLRIAGQTHE